MILHKSFAGNSSGNRAVYCTAVLLLAVCLSVLSGCGSGPFFIPVCQANNDCTSTGGGTFSSFAYVANATVGTLALLPLPTAAFSSLSLSSYSLGATPTAIAATPTGTFLYLATTAGNVFVYSIGTNGALTIGNGGNFLVQTLSPVSMVVDPTGNWLFLISSSISAILEYQINPTTGTLTAVNGNGTTLDAGTPAQVYVTPSDSAVYVALGNGGVDTFAFNSTSGALTNQGHLAPRSSDGVADNALVADNNSAFLFVGETGTGMRVFNIVTNGALTEVAGSPFASPLGQSSIVVDPTNSFVYVASKTGTAITGYSLGVTGALTVLPNSPFATGSGPIAMSLDSTGTYLLVASAGGGPDLQVFSFDATTLGNLDSVATAVTGTDPTGPVSLAVVP